MTVYIEPLCSGKAKSERERKYAEWTKAAGMKSFADAFELRPSDLNPQESPNGEEAWR